MFCMRPVIGVSINTRKVSFHERFIIKEIMPSVLMNVLSSTLTFRHTVLPIRLVSLDNLDVISPAQKWKEISLLFLILSHSILSSFFLPCLILSLFVLSWPDLICPSHQEIIQHNCKSYYKGLTCLYGLKESNFLFGQSLKQLDFHSACEGTDDTK